MARTTVKSTYALDVETVRDLEEMARRWKVSKSEALRRAIRAAKLAPASQAVEKAATLDELQRALHLSPDAARRWQDRVRRERHAASVRSAAQ
jgi:ribbon-helix-helix CopG family protein